MVFKYGVYYKPTKRIASRHRTKRAAINNIEKRWDKRLRKSLKVIKLSKKQKK